MLLARYPPRERNFSRVLFPGETEEDFEASVSALEEIRFDLVHTAAYSERTGTPAANMPGALPQEVRLSRLTRINAVRQNLDIEIL